MTTKATEYVTSRPDLMVIAERISPQSRVLDLGCGDGLLLRYLMETKGVKALGIEISQDEIIKCIGNGVPVIHGDLNQKLDYIQDGSFDFVILSCTLQEMVHPHRLLAEMMRIGRRAIVGVINFGFIWTRFQLFVFGKMPVSKTLPHQWYSTPNIHLGTLKDFKKLCRELNIHVLETIPLSASGRTESLPQLWPNLLSTNCVFVVEKNPAAPVRSKPRRKRRL